MHPTPLRSTTSQAVGDLCTHGFAVSLYDKLEAEVSTHVAMLVQSLVGQTEDPASFLQAVQGMWTTLCEQMVTVRSIFWTLDRKYALATPGVRSLWYVRVCSDSIVQLLCLCGEQTAVRFHDGVIPTSPRWLVAAGTWACTTPV